MLIFRRGHTHINQDNLSEYLDGRLSVAAASRIDRHLAECAACRQELDTLRTTVSLLRRMPELSLPRSFILPGPPPAAVAVRPPVPLRMPQWVYSGAAAAAALVLAVLVSADASGFLSSAPPGESRETAAALQAAPERRQRDGGATTIEMAAPKAPVENQAVATKKGISIAVTPGVEITEVQAQAPAVREAAAPAQPVAEAEIPAEESAPQPPVAAMAAAEEEVPAADAATPLPVAAFAAAEAPPEPTPVVADPSRVTPSAQGTNKSWRVLEGLMAVAAVAFFASWLLRRRTER